MDLSAEQPASHTKDATRRDERATFATDEIMLLSPDGANNTHKYQSLSLCRNTTKPRKAGIHFPDLTSIRRLTTLWLLEVSLLFGLVMQLSIISRSFNPLYPALRTGIMLIPLSSSDANITKSIILISSTTREVLDHFTSSGAII